MRVLGYVRVSQRKGRTGERFISPTAQREAIEAWAQAHNAQVIDVLEEIDESGSRRDRPKLLRCVEAIESGEVDGLVMAKLDRYYRDQLGGHETMKRIKDARGFIVVPGDGIDTRNDSGKMLFGFLLTIAEGQLDRYREQFADARARAVARGIHPCPVPPFGYTRDTDERGRVEGPLRPSDSAPLVTDLFTRRASGEPLAALARWLTSHGALSAYGSPTWTSRAVKGIVRNRVYLGEARHGEFVNAIAHPALTDELTWRRAQHPGVVPAPRSNNPALLTGLIRCAGCRYGMKSYINKNGRREYACHRRHPWGKCPAPASSSDPALEPFVVAEFFSALDAQRARPVADTRTFKNAQRAWEQAQGDTASYRDDPRILRALGAERYAAGLELRVKAEEDARTAVERLTPIAGAIDTQELHATWPSLTVVQQRRLLRLVIDCVFLRRGTTPATERLFICGRGEAPELPALGRGPARPIGPFDW